MWRYKNEKKIFKKWGRCRPNTSLFVLISPTVFEIQGFEISRKHPPPLIFRKHCHATVLSRGDSIPSNKKRKKKTFFEVSQDVLGSVAPDKVISKTVFSKYLKNRFRYQKMCKIKCVDLKIFNNLLPWHILISRTVFEIQGSKKT